MAFIVTLRQQLAAQKPRSTRSVKGGVKLYQWGGVKVGQ
jgi:hypothetical protein